MPVQAAAVGIFAGLGKADRREQDPIRQVRLAVSNLDAVEPDPWAVTRKATPGIDKVRRQPCLECSGQSGGLGHALAYSIASQKACLST